MQSGFATLSCLVSILPSDRVNSDGLPSLTIQKGVVQSVWMHPKTKQLDYKVAMMQSGKICSVSEEDLVFGIGCSVYVSLKTKATIIIFRWDESGISYTVQLEHSSDRDESTLSFLDNVASDSVTFRKTDNDIAITVKDASQECKPLMQQEMHTATEQMQAFNMISPDHTDTPSPDHNPDTPKTIDHLLQHSISGGGHSNNQRIPRKRQKVGSGDAVLPCNTSNDFVEVIIPLWMQEDEHIKRALYCEYDKHVLLFHLINNPQQSHHFTSDSSFGRLHKPSQGNKQCPDIESDQC